MIHDCDGDDCANYNHYSYDNDYVNKLTINVVSADDADNNVGCMDYDDYNWQLM